MVKAATIIGCTLAGGVIVALWGVLFTRIGTCNGERVARERAAAIEAEHERREADPEYARTARYRDALRERDRKLGR